MFAILHLLGMFIVDLFKSRRRRGIAWVQGVLALEIAKEGGAATD